MMAVICAFARKPPTPSVTTARAIPSRMRDLLVIETPIRASPTAARQRSNAKPPCRQAPRRHGGLPRRCQLTDAISANGQLSEPPGGLGCKVAGHRLVPFHADDRAARGGGKEVVGDERRPGAWRYRD